MMNQKKIEKNDNKKQKNEEISFIDKVCQKATKKSHEDDQDTVKH